MDSSRKPKGHKNFYIDLDHPQDYVFTCGDIVSGKCVLLSTHDEDVGSIIISFHGTINTQVDVATKSTNNQLHNAHYDSEDILFSECKSLYQGTYTLRKNVPYEWPFEFRVPNSLPPCGTFGGGVSNGNAKVFYELEACRGRTWQDSNSLRKHVDMGHEMKYAPFQPSRLLAKVGSFTGMIALATLSVTPPRPRRADPNMLSCSIDQQFPVSEFPNMPHKHNLFRSRHAKGPSAACTVVLQLPQNLIQGTSIPVFLQLISHDGHSVSPVSLRSADFVLTEHTNIFSSLGHHKNTHSRKHVILHESKTNILLTPNIWLDIGAMFNLRADHALVPKFEHSLLSVSYDLKANIVIESGDQNFKEDFVVEEVQVFSSRTLESPLSKDYFCSFTPERRVTASSTYVYDSSIDEIVPSQNIDESMGNAYLALSRVLTRNFIPHDPAENPRGEAVVILKGRPPLYGAEPRHSTSFPVMIQLPPPSNPPIESVHDALESDQAFLDKILDEESGISRGSRPGVAGDVQPRSFAYSWNATPPLFGPFQASGIKFTSIRLEISDASYHQNVPNEIANPPPYSSAAATPTNPLSATYLLNMCLRGTLVEHDSNCYNSGSVADALYVINEFGKDLSSAVHVIDTKTAHLAANKHRILQEPLASLGVGVMTGTGKGNCEEEEIAGERRDKRNAVAGFGMQELGVALPGSEAAGHTRSNYKDEKRMSDP